MNLIKWYDRRTRVRYWGKRLITWKNLKNVWRSLKRETREGKNRWRSWRRVMCVSQVKEIRRIGVECSLILKLEWWRMRCWLRFTVRRKKGLSWNYWTTLKIFISVSQPPACCPLGIQLLALPSSLRYILSPNDSCFKSISAQLFHCFRLWVADGWRVQDDSQRCSQKSEESLHESHEHPWRSVLVYQTVSFLLFFIFRGLILYQLWNFKFQRFHLLVYITWKRKSFAGKFFRWTRFHNIRLLK